MTLAVQRKLGSAAAFGFYRTLLSKPGRIDGPGALTAATALGVPQAEIEEIADSDEVRLALRSHMRMAADLGSTPPPPTYSAIRASSAIPARNPWPR